MVLIDLLINTQGCQKLSICGGKKKSSTCAAQSSEVCPYPGMSGLKQPGLTGEKCKELVLTINVWLVIRCSHLDYNNFYISNYTEIKINLDLKYP